MLVRAFLGFFSTTIRPRSRRWLKAGTSRRFGTFFTQTRSCTTQSAASRQTSSRRLRALAHEITVSSSALAMGPPAWKPLWRTAYCRRVYGRYSVLRSLFTAGTRSSRPTYSRWHAEGSNFTIGFVAVSVYVYCRKSCWTLVQFFATLPICR